MNLKSVKFKPCPELNAIDTNCNTCANMVRDLDKYKKVQAAIEKRERSEFERKQAKGLIRKGAQFQFSKSNIQYGFCTKFEKEVSFISTLCMPENDNCWVPRTKSKKK